MKCKTGEESLFPAYPELLQAGAGLAQGPLCLLT